MKNFFIFTIVFLFLFPIFIFAETVSNIQIIPDLDISYFSTYNIRADVSGSPISVEVEVQGINGSGGDYWNYFVNGATSSDQIIKTLTATSTYYESTNIYPDNIYPEIFFAPSSITWANIPSDIELRRNNYHLLHFENPFTMTASSSFLLN